MKCPFLFGYKLMPESDAGLCLYAQKHGTLGARKRNEALKE